MKKLLIFSFLVILTGCSHRKSISDVSRNSFSVESISAIDSRPSIYFDDNLKEIILLLHNNFSQEEIKTHLKISDKTYDEQINLLFGEGLLKKKDKDKFVPSFMVIGREEGKEIKKIADSLGREMSAMAIERIDKIKSASAKLHPLHKRSFDETALLLIGDILYNHWQIKLIEDNFTRSSPPLRGAKRYYMALLENESKGNNNPFGLFLHRTEANEIATMGSYGKRMQENSLNINDPGLNQKGSEQRPVFSVEDQDSFRSISTIISADLTSYLEKNRALFLKMYLNSVYKDQTSFGEWFIWVYQFMVSAALETIIEKKIIPDNAAGNVQFVLANSRKR